MACVEKTQAVTKAMEERWGVGLLTLASRNWELAVQLRGKSFQRNLDTYRMLTRWGEEYWRKYCREYCREYWRKYWREY